MSKDKCCGNCKHFKDEDILGFGYCEYHENGRQAGYFCGNHVDAPNSFNGWTEITPDNMSEVYNIQVNRLVIAWEQGGMTICRMFQDISPTISTMAKIGGYYYMELPELKIE